MTKTYTPFHLAFRVNRNRRTPRARDGPDRPPAATEPPTPDGTHGRPRTTQAAQQERSDDACPLRPVAPRSPSGTRKLRDANPTDVKSGLPGTNMDTGSLERLNQDEITPSPLETEPPDDSGAARSRDDGLPWIWGRPTHQHLVLRVLVVA